MQNRILIDPKTFAQQATQLQGTLALSDLDKRVSQHEFLANPHATVAYAIKGGTDRLQRPFLNVAVQSELSLNCQRCLTATDFSLDECAVITLFDDETALDDAMLADEELEGMLMSAEIDVCSLIEEQILMGLPFAPRHEVCEHEQMGEINRDKPNPFAVLKGI